jgi:cobalt-zinc-cadmium efflux system outer membrane protein
MTTRIVLSVLIAALSAGTPAYAQTPIERPIADHYIDPVDGLSLEQAITQALQQEPSLRSARTEIDVARGLRVQASLRPNPSLSFERREEPDGSDNQTAVAMEWPLDLFRKGPRVAVADRELQTAQLTVADRERRLAAEVRTKYGGVLETLRDLTILDELVATTRRQHTVLRSRVEEGATPPLERDLLDVELRRLQADRVLQAGRTEAALFELKRILGMRADARLRIRDTLEELVQREGATAASPVSATSAVLEERADVREAAARVGLAEARIERARSEGRFDVSLFANYMRMDAGFPQRAFASGGSLEPIRGRFRYVSAGAIVTVPVLNRNQGQIAAAQAERAGAAAAYEAARLTAEAELAAARTRDAYARQAVNTYSSEARALAQQNLKVVSQSYDLGRVTVFDVLAEQRRYFDVERAYTEALTAAYQARTALDLAVGGVR